MPVVVVGNISVGGTGKTPLVIFLSKWLTSQGYRPGVITRGYGGGSPQWPIAVTADSDPDMTGDEPVLIARATDCPVVAGPLRQAVAEYLLDHNDCNIIISDDGLQHYALMRDLEIVVVDGERRHGNGLCLPAGPLREPVSRLTGVDFVIVNGGDCESGEFTMDIVPAQVNNLNNPDELRELSTFSGANVHAVAGIGHTERFFSMLECAGLQIIRHGFPDHHRFKPQDISFNDDLPVLMTEKDAVKCMAFARPQLWMVRIDALPEQLFLDRLLIQIRKLEKG